MGLLVLFVLLCAVLSRTVGLVGVPLAFSGAYTLLAGALLVAMRSTTQRAGWRHLAGSFIRLLVAGAVMYAVARFGLYLTGTGVGIASRAAILIVVGGAASVAYLGTSLALGSEEPRQLPPLAKRRFVGRIGAEGLIVADPRTKLAVHDGGPGHAQSRPPVVKVSRAI